MATRLQQRRYQVMWLRRRRKAWLAEHGPCSRCGARKRLQVDHIDPTQKVDHKVWSWRKERRDAELAKCQVLCERCHRYKSMVDRRIGAISPKVPRFVPRPVFSELC